MTPVPTRLGGSFGYTVTGDAPGSPYMEDGQSAATQYEEARKHGVQDKDVFIDEGVSGYHVAPDAREQWRKAEHDLRHGGTLIVRWLDRISRRNDELHATMRRLMELEVRVECTLNGMVFDGKAKDPIEKATLDAILAFMAAQGKPTI